MPVSGVRRSALCVTDRLRGHATAGVRGAFYRNFFAGCEWDFEIIDATDAGAAAVLSAARGHDWIVLVKVASYDLVRSLRKATKETGVTLVFDFSDALWKPVHRRAGWHDLERILGLVDLVVCENEYLQTFARRHQKNPLGVITAPTAVPLEAFDRARAQNLPAVREPSDPIVERVVVGWVGSRTTATALYKVRDTLVRLALRHPGLHVRLLGVTPAAAATILGEVPHSVRTDYDEATMISEMIGLDIGLYPEPFDTEDYAARGPLKALLYMAAGVPVVCAPAGDCGRLLRDGESGMLAASPMEWEHKLDRLIGDASLRAAMGRRALDIVRSTQNPEVLYGALRGALEESSWKLFIHPERPFTTTASEICVSLGFRTQAFAMRVLRVLKRRGRRAR